MVGTTREALALASWLDDHLTELQALAAETTVHGRLVEIRPHVFGRRVFAQFVFSTGDAMGLNMVNLAVDRVCRQVAEAVPCERWYLRCNYSSDKKPAAINLFRPYGKEVAIDLTLPASVVEAHLGVSPADLVEFAASGRLGTMQAGALGANAHFANGLAAIYIACGQDVAQIVNASIGFLDVELVGADDLYVAAGCRTWWSARSAVEPGSRRSASAWPCSAATEKARRRSSPRSSGRPSSQASSRSAQPWPMIASSRPTGGAGASPPFPGSCRHRQRSRPKVAIACRVPYCQGLQVFGPFPQSGLALPPLVLELSGRWALRVSSAFRPKRLFRQTNLLPR